jgi:hypothetical protein
MFEFFTFERKREFINLLIQGGNAEMHGAEIGVWKGDTTAYLLDKNPGLHMTGIDPYPVVENNTEADLLRFGVDHWLWFKDNVDADGMYAQTSLRLSLYGERAELIRKPSVDAAKDFPDEHFDFVYIDGNHFYESVKADIVAWVRKVKVGGWIIGDDFSWLLRSDQVARAVMESFGYEYGMMADTWFAKRV